MHLNYFFFPLSKIYLLQISCIRQNYVKHLSRDQSSSKTDVKKIQFCEFNFNMLFVFAGMSVIRGTTAADPDSIISVQASTTYSAEPSENPLDVLSRAATMVEKSSEIIGHGKVSPPPSSIKKGLSGSQSLSCIERHPSFKERTHPKFRKSATPDYMVALDVARGLKRQTSIQSDQSENNMDTSLPNNNSLQPHEDLPLDMSIKKRPATPPSLPPPPPYRTPTHFMYKSPPPYPATPSPPTSHVPPTSSLPPLPPPPTYEDSTIKCTYPTINMQQQQPAPPTSILPPPPNLHQEPEEKTKIKEITIITSECILYFLYSLSTNVSTYLLSCQKIASHQKSDS